MKRLALAFAIIVATPLVPPRAEAKEVDARPILRNTLVNYIRPSYALLSRRAVVVERASHVLCNDPSPTTLERARAAFSDLVRAWSGIEWFRVGPAMSENRLERFLFYPDRKGIGLRQVRRALSSDDPEVTDVSSLARKSVAMQGLGALEYLLYGEGAGELAETPDTFRCAYGRAIATNLATIAAELRLGWAGDSATVAAFLEPGPLNQLFRDDIEALNLIIETLVHGLEGIRDIRIGYFLREPGRDVPRAAIFRRSNLTLASITWNLRGLETLFNVSGFEDVLPDDAGALAEQLRFELAQAIRTAQAFNGDIEATVSAEAERESLEYLRIAIGFAIGRLNEQIAPAAGLAAGFSFGDGD